MRSGAKFKKNASEAAQTVDGGVRLMWAGDADGNNNVLFSGPNNDANNIQNTVITAPGNVLGLATYSYAGYHNQDTSLNGAALFSGPSNDANELIKNNVLAYPANILSLLTYTINEQMP